jgi:hypothetical protein
MHIWQGDILKTDIDKIWEEAGAEKCEWIEEVNLLPRENL